MYEYDIQEFTDSNTLRCEVYYRGDSRYVKQREHIGTITTNCYLCRSWTAFGVLSVLVGGALGICGLSLVLDSDDLIARRAGGWVALITGAISLLAGFYLACYGGAKLDRWQRNDKAEKMVRDVVNSRMPRAIAAFLQGRIQGDAGIETPLLVTSDPNP